MFKKINQQFEKLFEENLNNQIIEETISKEKQKEETNKSDPAKKNIVQFEASNDLELIHNVSYIFKEVADLNTLKILFQKISLCFEAGFLMVRNASEFDFSLQSGFHSGAEFKIVKNTPKINLPKIKIDEVLKSESSGILKTFNLSHLDTENKFYNYLFAIDSRHYIVVFSKSAEPWSQLKIEALQKTILKINFNL